MNLWKSAGLALLLVLVASCGGDGGSSNPTLTVYAIENFSGVYKFDLTQIVTNSPAGSTVTYNNPTNGIAVSQTNSSQIMYGAIIATTPDIVDTCSMQLSGNFDIPPDSLANGNVAGTTGTVTAISESCYELQWFKITGLSVDASQLTDAIAAADYGTFWKLIGNGGVNGLADLGNNQPVTVYCGVNETGESIVITGAPTPMQNFLLGC